MTTALIGRNGTGKSTLLRAIAGLNRRYKGSIIINGIDIHNIVPKDMARLLAVVTTERIRIPDFSALQVVEMGRAIYSGWNGRLSANDKRVAQEALEAVGMADFANRPLQFLSDGECQRVMIARAIAQDTPVIILDEPTSFLDIPNRYQLIELLNKLAHEHGKCIFFSTHELDIALKTCDRIALLSQSCLALLPPSSPDIHTFLSDLLPSAAL